MFSISPFRWNMANTIFLLALGGLVFLSWLGVPMPLAAQSFVRISDIQGSGLSSPLRERWVDTFGIVTAVLEEGFYLQDPAGDGDAQTSEGIYVYLSRRPKVEVGACVLLTRAYVDEFYGKTELSKLKSVEPSDRCQAATVIPVSIPVARLYQAPESLFEAQEGMLVQVDNLAGVVQGSTKYFDNGEAELALLRDVSAVQLPAGRVFQAQPEQSSAMIFLSNALGDSLPDVRWGDQIAIGVPTESGPRAMAILDYNFEKYQLLLLPNQPNEVQAQPPPQPEQAAPTQPDEVTICSTNLWALGRGSAQHPNPLDFADQVKKRAKAIAETLFGCTIIGLQEAGSQEAVEALASELRTQYGLAYDAWAGSGYQADNSEFPLTTGFLTLKERVEVSSVEMLQICSPVDYEVLPGEMSCPEGEFLLFDRPSLIVDLKVRGDWEGSYPIRVISNHLKSKGGDERVNVVRRTQQAQTVAAKVQRWIEHDPAAQIVVLGDLNDYYGSASVEALRTGVTPALFHSYDLLPKLDRYTYVFNGASQVLDHVLVSAVLQSQIAEVNVLHVNSNFAYPEEVDLSTVIHASDHDPVLLRLRPKGAATLSANLHFPGIVATLLDAANVVVDRQQSDDQGALRFWNLQPGKYTVQLDAPTHLKIEQSEISFELTAGNNDLPPLVIQHESVELLRAILETTATLMSN